jgi:crotonobetainyl-CoA:carnitine CoA-transferase CaiB-like acyl-CoA transferase
MIAEVKHSVAGNYKLPNSPFKLSKTPIELEKGSPVLGENNREIFGQLGLSADEIDEMLKQQAQVRTMFSEWAMK